MELCGKWMCKKVVPCTLFIYFQGVIDNLLEVRARGRGGSRLGVSGRHRCNSDELFAMRDDDGVKGNPTDVNDRRSRQTTTIDMPERGAHAP